MSKKNQVSEAEVIATNEIDKEVESIVNDTSTSKSYKIRKLHVLFGGDNKARSQVSKVLNIRYQHVRNVLITPLKKV